MEKQEEVFVAQFDYEDEDSDEERISFKKGDRIIVTNQSTDWWFGRLERSGSEGWVPPAFLEPVESTPLPTLPEASPAGEGGGGFLRRSSAASSKRRSGPDLDVGNISTGRRSSSTSQLPPTACLTRVQPLEFYAALSAEEKRRLRDQALREMLELEAEYTDLLGKFIEGPITDMRSRRSEFTARLLDDPVVVVAFNAICEIHSLSTELMEALRQHAALCDAGKPEEGYDVAVAGVKRFASMLPVYGQYVEDEASLVNLLTQEARSLGRYLAANPLPQRADMNFEDYISLPVDHWADFCDLLEHLHHLDGLREGTALDAAVRQALEAAEDIEDRVERRERQLQLLRIQQRFIGYVDLFKPNRKLVAEGELQQVMPSSGRRRRVAVFVFDDALVVAVPRAAGLQLQFSVNLLACAVWPLEDTQKVGHAFRLDTAELPASEPSHGLAGEPSQANHKRSQGIGKILGHLSAEVSLQSLGRHSCTLCAYHEEGKAQWMDLLNRLCRDARSHSADLNRRARCGEAAETRRASADADISAHFGGGGGGAPAFVALTHDLLGKLKLFSRNLRVMHANLLTPLDNLSRGIAHDAHTKEGISGNTNLLLAVTKGAMRRQGLNAKRDALRIPHMAVFLDVVPKIQTFAQSIIQDLRFRFEAYVAAVSTADQQQPAAAEAAAARFSLSEAFPLKSMEQAYATYARIFNSAANTLNKNVFQSVISSIEGDLAPLTVQEHLEQPILFIPYLVDQLGDIFEAMPADHSDKQALSECCGAVVEICDTMKRILEDRQNYETIKSIRESIISGALFPDETIERLLDGEKRRFVKEGPLVKICRRDNKTFQFWLFNDALMYGSPLTSGLYQFNRVLYLNTTTIIKSTSQTNAFEIRNPVKSFVVLAIDEEEREEWTEELNACIQQCKDETVSETTGGETHAPIWKPDSQGDFCCICRESFSILRRRHHCRSCGQHVCDVHSKTRWVLPHIDPVKKQRICDGCVALQDRGNSPNAQAPTLSTLLKAASDMDLTNSKKKKPAVEEEGDDGPFFLEGDGLDEDLPPTVTHQQQSSAPPPPVPPRATSPPMPPPRAGGSPPPPVPPRVVGGAPPPVPTRPSTATATAPPPVPTRPSTATATAPPPVPTRPSTATATAPPPVPTRPSTATATAPPPVPTRPSTATATAPPPVPTRPSTSVAAGGAPVPPPRPNRPAPAMPMVNSPLQPPVTRTTDKAPPPVPPQRPPKPQSMLETGPPPVPQRVTSLSAKAKGSVSRMEANKSNLLQTALNKYTTEVGASQGDESGGEDSGDDEP